MVLHFILEQAERLTFTSSISVANLSLSELAAELAAKQEVNKQAQLISV